MPDAEPEQELLEESAAREWLRDHGLPKGRDKFRGLLGKEIAYEQGRGSTPNLVYVFSLKDYLQRCKAQAEDRRRKRK